MSDSLEHEHRRRNDRAQEFHAPTLRRIPETETRAPFRASQSWRVVMMVMKISVAFLVMALALSPIGLLTPAAAADQVVRVDGLVQWIGGQQMVVQADTGPSVGVDLTS